VTNLRLGVVDNSSSAESRELVTAFTESLAFKVTGYYLSESEMSEDLSEGKLNAGIVIPSDYADKRTRGESANIQLLVDAVDSNTATIAAGYAGRIVASLNQTIVASTPRKSPQAAPGGSAQTPSVPPRASRASITPRVALLYNPALLNSWFIVTGLIGALLVLQGSIVAAASMVREKEVGTIEQLLMTPAEAAAIITAKIAPIFLLLTADIGLSLTVARIVFGVPVRGSLLLFVVSGSLCVLSGIGIGTMIATFVNSQQQAQLMSFFVNPPLILLSGAMTPIEAMPQWIQPLTLLNPVRHFGVISRGILLKGTGMDVLYPNFLALLGFCILLVSISAWRFRRQLR
ncbi:MAG TPA: ABC transporter permease, partial [Pyrinomonadaceae bacterium]|nr:ABC transporter permease [Pyrinomonadaceae bacterium]